MSCINKRCEIAYTVFLMRGNSLLRIMLNFLGHLIHVVLFGTIKVKVKLSLCFFLTDHHAMKAYCGSGGIAPHII
jgi:hypothetical protein